MALPDDAEAPREDESGAPSERDVPIEQLSVEPPPVEEAPTTTGADDAAAPPPPERDSTTREPSADEPASAPVEPRVATAPSDPRRAGLGASAALPSKDARRTAKVVIGASAALVAIVVTLSATLRLGPAKPALPSPSASASSSASAATSASAAASVVPPPSTVPKEPTMQGPWRITSLEGDAAIKLVDGAVERKSFVDAIAGAGVPKAQVYRLMKAFHDVRKFDKTHRRDHFVAALDRASRRLVAFEYVASPTEVYQAREGSDGLLVATKLDLHVEERRVAAGVVVGDDLAASCREAGLDETIVDLLDDALEGRAQVTGIHAGATLRLVAQAETALGAFARYASIDALEYRPAGSDSPLRVYRFAGRKTHGYFDGRGRQPYHGGWRTPIPGGRVTSRFNPRRMHPILHVVMPHNGVDFGAPAGTPVYAASFGTVALAAEAGPSGNLVVIDHAGGLATGYAHLSRFASGLRQGQKVETRQLVGYVGSTGRSTGPHLHFSLKKNGVFVDPLTLKLDGERVLSKSEREAFDAHKLELDALLDAIALPIAAPPPPEPATSASPAGEADADLPEAGAEGEGGEAEAPAEGLEDETPQ